MVFCLQDGQRSLVWASLIVEIPLIFSYQYKITSSMFQMCFCALHCSWHQSKLFTFDADSLSSSLVQPNKRLSSHMLQQQVFGQ